MLSHCLVLILWAVTARGGQATITKTPSCQRAMTLFRDFVSWCNVTNCVWTCFASFLRRSNSVSVAADGDDSSGGAHGGGTVRVWHQPASALHTASAAGAPQAGSAGRGRQASGQRQSLDAAAMQGLAPPLAAPAPHPPHHAGASPDKPDQWLL